ncbi:MAG: acyltransferase [Clostridia bacterium]|nr:acyltransferase [Clostridia bacterium]
MVIFIVMLLLLCLFEIKFTGKNGFEDYMSPKKTGAIKGIFVIIVVLSHLRQYITLDASWYNVSFQKFMVFLGQLMVVMFLFYSGYGVLLGLEKKEGYAKSIITKRVPKVFIHYDIAVVVFFVLGHLTGTKYPIKRLLLSLVGLDGVGNSVWFIVVIIALYIVTFFAFIIVRRNVVVGTAITTVLSVGLVVFFCYFREGQYWWYDTVMCYPLGMWYAIAKPYIDKKLMPSFGKWFACTAVSIAAFIALRELRFSMNGSRTVFIFEALVFALVIVFVSMRMSICNPVLCWFGKRVFGIYILQRIPMIVLSYFGLNDKPFLFSAACFAITIVLAEIFERLTDKLDIALKLTKKNS